MRSDTVEVLAAEHFFEGMSSRHLGRLALTVGVVEIPAGRRLLEEGGQADRFWLIKAGTVALDLHVPGRGTIVLETLGPGSILGWSWLFPPHQWWFGAVTTEPVRALRFDGRLVRTLCAADPSLGYALSSRFGAVLMDRLEAARVRLLDLYGLPKAAR